MILKHTVRFDGTCFYPCMLMAVLALGERPLAVFPETLTSWTNIAAWQQMPTFWGNSSKLTRDPDRFGFPFVSLLLVPSKAAVMGGERGGEEALPG